MGEPERTPALNELSHATFSLGLKTRRCLWRGGNRKGGCHFVFSGLQKSLFFFF